MASQEQWYRNRKTKPHKQIFEFIRQRREDTSATLTNDLFRDKYEDRGSVLDEREGENRDRRTRDNVIANAIEAVHNKTAKGMPDPLVQTSNGDFKLQRRAEKLTAWLLGEADRLGLEEHGEEVELESLMVGMGGLKFYAEGDSPACEIVYADDIFVDPREERQKAVRTLYHVRPMDKLVLEQLYPKHASKIRDSEVLGDDDETYGQDDGDIVSGSHGQATEMTLVVEAWRLPHRGSSGRWVQCIDTATLVDEPWVCDTFPFEFLRYATRPRRFDGIGIAEKLLGQQSELNMVGGIISDSIPRMVTAWFARADTQFATMSCDVPGMVYTSETGEAPTVLAPAPVSPMVMQYRDAEIARSYEHTGVSQLTAQGQKPAGLDSGKALRVHNEIEAGRFYLYGRRRERFYTGCYQQIIRVADEILKKNPKADLNALGGTDDFEQVAFGDVAFGADPYRIKVFPVSRLSNQPSARMEEVHGIMQIDPNMDPATALELLDLPDLKRHSALRDAKRKLVKRLISKALDGEPVADRVNEYTDMPYLIEIGGHEHELALLNGADIDELDELRTLIDTAKSHLQNAAEPPELPSPIPGAAPPPMAAVPGPGPVPGPVPLPTESA